MAFLDQTPAAWLHRVNGTLLHTGNGNRRGGGISNEINTINHTGVVRLRRRHHRPLQEFELWVIIERDVKAPLQPTCQAATIISECEYEMSHDRIEMKHWRRPNGTWSLVHLTSEKAAADVINLVAFNIVTIGALVVK